MNRLNEESNDMVIAFAAFGFTVLAVIIIGTVLLNPPAYAPDIPTTYPAPMVHEQYILFPSIASLHEQTGQDSGELPLPAEVTAPV